ncbi:MAG: redox-regulated ATPase YchF [Anaerolineales bacterium]|nr:redox-regulated ATPase YchF [Chloroflexota bacterium]MBL6982292.1 redox-regulated ATPase YchF [Anaerolineales bacterium]
MGLKIGIIGLPNVGKSTVFNALSGAQNAEVANYPFCTIQPNRAIVPLHDPRLEKLHALVGVPKIIYATIEFVDIAGLVKGASQGEGLGNQFLGNIRDVDALVHVVRCFEDPNVVHVSADIKPDEDIDTINLELVIADLEQVERKIERLTSEVKGDKKLLPVMAMAQNLKTHLEAGNSASSFTERSSASYKSLAHELRFLTAKPVIYAANVDEDGLAEDGPLTKNVIEIAKKHNADFLKVCAKLESEMVDMSKEEREEFLALAGVEESGLNQVVSKGFAILDLISFFTKNENEVRAWNIAQGTTAPQAAGEIHTDFERGFIRAEVVSFETFAEHGNDSALKTAGQMRSEGKEYVVQDGDVILFRFNV